MTDLHPFEPKYFLNGFPKSGLHLIWLMMLAISKPTPAQEHWIGAWVGTFNDNSWSNRWLPLEKVLFRVSQLRNGHFLKSHCGYRPEIEQFLYYSGITHIFIYRDLRDVAVSQAYHILNKDDGLFPHPDKDTYRSLGNFSEVLKAVIVGTGKWPGVIERWEQYAPWLDVDLVYKVRFEEARHEPEKVASGILWHGLNRIASVFYEQEIPLLQDVHDALVKTMVKNAGVRTNSPSFRKGNVGDWREHFTPEIKQMFKETDKDSWLVRLGYEDNEDW